MFKIKKERYCKRWMIAIAGGKKRLKFHSKNSNKGKGPQSIEVRRGGEEEEEEKKEEQEGQ